ncbi:nucleotidyltransferase family protein [uncultured Methylobacterium sp.]|uniref:nucleotidyltransferase family protein n=1 Tax=uncultured Methylobacterium sp. TaxID=157278 RepID=UPI0035C9E6D5
MNEADAITRLQSHADAVQAMGETSLYLYGSTVRNEASAGSDLDLFIEYDPASRLNAFDLIGIKLFLEERLGTDVDVTTRDGLHPRLCDGIEQSAVRVF